MDILFALLLGISFGSIPFGIIFARTFNLGDIKKIGSGNIGATNVLRTGNKLAAALTLLCDTLKGTIVFITCIYFELNIYVGAIAVFAGHLYPIWLGGKGGKGVAVYLGLTLGLFYQQIFLAGFTFAAVWLIVAAIFRYSSLASLLATAAVPLVLIFASDEYAILFFMLTALCWLKHVDNIKRLLAGTETKIGK